MGVVWGALIACGAPPPDDPKAAVSDDTDPVQHSDPPDSDEPERDPPESDPPDSDEPVVETDDSEPSGDSDPPVDTTHSDPPAAPDLGRGFVDLTTPLYAATPRYVFGGDRAVREQPDLSHGAFVDLDHDGAPEVLLVGTSAVVGERPSAWVLRYDAGAEALVPDAGLTALLAAVEPSVLHLGDVDGDGDDDVVSGRFDVPPLAGAGGLPPADEQLYQGLYHGALVDIDEDGLVDILHDARGCTGAPWGVWWADGRGWSARDMVTWSIPASPYVSGLARLGGQRVVLALGAPCDTVNFHPGFYTQESYDAEDLPMFGGRDILPADSAFKLDPLWPGLPISARRPMGAAVADLDGDGRTDLAIATTYSHLLVFLDRGSLPLVDHTIAADAVLPQRWPDGRPGALDIQKPWGIAALDLDRDDQLDLVCTNGRDFGDWMDDSLGLYTPLLYLQRGGAWQEWTAAANLAFVQDSRSLTVGDLDRDGRPDLLLGGNGAPARVLLNRIDGGRRPVAVRLVGTTSGVAAHGTVLRFEDDGALGPAQVVGGVISMGPVSEPILFGTTGPDGAADRVHIDWPAGWSQVVEGLTADAVHTVVEPETLRLSARVAPADGATVVTLTVTPRDERGAPRAAVVEVRLRAGIGALRGPPQQVGDSVVQEVVAPSVPGFATFEVVVDGVVLGVRPRVGWL